MKYYFSFVILALSVAGLHAQTPCFDASLVDPTGFCPLVFDPVCGCDGLTYDNWCFAEVTGGNTSWVDGPCSFSSSDCLDLAPVDFGACEMAMGIVVIDGQCSYLSGCGWEVDGVDYSAYGFESMADCANACPENVSCFDLSEMDFGECDMVLGVGYADGSCQSISGCDWVAADGVDYSSYFFETIEDCAFDCEEATECVDPDLADPMIDCDPFFANPVCGCDSLTHLNDCTATYEDWVSSFEPGACAGDCFDSTRVFLDMGCPEIYEPVCGCDSVTYGNTCEAWYFGGIADWTDGECPWIGVEETTRAEFRIVPNPSSGRIELLGLEADTNWRVLDVSGRVLARGQGRFAELDLPRGMYWIVAGARHGVIVLE